MKKLLLSIIIVTTVSISFAQIPMNGLVSYYPFSGNAADSVGNNDGTVSGATLTMDRFGMANSAYSFNSNNANSITLPASTFHYANYTYSFWINMPSLPSFGNHSVIMSIGGSGADQGVSMNNNYFGGSITFDGVGSYSSASVATYTEGPTLDLNSWHHVVSIRDSNYLKTYVDGQLAVVSLSSNGALPTYGTSSAAKIGCRFNGSLPFNGKIDDVRIYNRALDSNEVESLYTENFCFQTITDTINVYDTTYVNIYDTTYVTVYDTTHISVTDTLIIDAVLVGINPPNNINRMKVYPNPTKEHLIIDNGNFALMSNYSVKIVNTQGQEVFNSNINQQVFDINLSSLTGKGIYFVMIYDPQNNLLEVKKIILQ